MSSIQRKSGEHGFTLERVKLAPREFANYDFMSFVIHSLYTLLGIIRHIQDYFVQHEKALAAEGLSAVHMPREFLMNFDEFKWRKVIQEALRSGLDLMISSEYLSILDRQHITQLHSLLKDFDEVRNILVVREPLSRAVSNYNQNCRSLFPAPFASMLLRDLKVIPDVRKWIDVFGEGCMQVVDYYGVLSSRFTLLHVILCEIAGYHCNNATASLELEARNENHSKDFTLLPVFHYLLAATDRKMCARPPDDSLIQAWQRMRTLVKASNVTLPMVPFDMTLMRSVAREQYEKLSAVEYSELPMWQMVQDPRWQRWLDDLRRPYTERRDFYKCNFTFSR